MKVMPGALLRVGAMAALHPVDYAKTLIQIGHEPLAPAQTKTLITQKPALALPSVQQLSAKCRGNTILGRRHCACVCA